MTTNVHNVRKYLESVDFENVCKKEVLAKVDRNIFLKYLIRHVTDDTRLIDCGQIGVRTVK